MSPGGAAPRFVGTARLWSLRDVIGRFGTSIVLMCRMFDHLESQIERMRAAHAKLPPGVPAPRLERAVADCPPQDLAAALLGGEAPEHPFPLTAAQIGRVASLLDRGCSVDELEACIRDARGRFHDEQDRVFFFHVKPDYVRYYAARSLFGDEAASAFPGAGDDMEEAGKCLALEQGTAAVFHLMRVMEAGLKALAGMLGVGYAPSWEGCINKINNNVKADHKGKPAEWKRDERFFEEVLGDLLAVKIAWRNPTMHIERRYTQAEAEQVFQSVRLFMCRLAPKVEPVP